jgi:16S rRNA (cytosine1402-N4)-methyltransferase
MHEPVLINEVIAALKPQKGDSYLDMTAGYGGHASAILTLTKNYQASVLVDRDQMAVKELKTKFDSKRVEILQMDFYSAAKALKKQGKTFNLILADLGVSSPHLDIASRGFSFRAEGPLDMRMDQMQSLTAETIVNQWSIEDLRQILREYGEEPHSNKIAKNIVEKRPIKTTTELAKIVAGSVGGKWQAKHPATRTFQALRIAVNDELGLLKMSLPILVDLLEPNGRLGIISFHSLEDRIVKKFVAENAGDRYDAVLVAPFKSPITAATNETVLNPRSRSAKLRVVAKINTTERTSDAY